MGEFGIGEAMKKMPKHPGTPEYTNWKSTGVTYLFDLAMEQKVHPDDIVVLKNIFEKAMSKMERDDSNYDLAEMSYQHLGAFVDGLNVGNGHTKITEIIYIPPNLEKPLTDNGLEGIQIALQVLSSATGLSSGSSAGEMLNNVLLMAGLGRISINDILTLRRISWTVIDQIPVREQLKLKVLSPISTQLAKFDDFIKGVDVGKMSRDPQ